MGPGDGPQCMWLASTLCGKREALGHAGSELRSHVVAEHHQPCKGEGRVQRRQQHLQRLPSLVLPRLPADEPKAGGGAAADTMVLQEPASILCCHRLLPRSPHLQAAPRWPGWPAASPRALPKRRCGASLSPAAHPHQVAAAAAARHSGWQQRLARRRAAGATGHALPLQGPSAVFGHAAE